MKNEQTHKFITEFWEYQKDYIKLLIEYSNKEQDEKRKQMYSDCKQIIKDQVRKKRAKQANIVEKIVRAKKELKEKEKKM